jgi:hypothetical protein
VEYDGDQQPPWHVRTTRSNRSTRTQDYVWNVPDGHTIVGVICGGQRRSHLSSLQFLCSGIVP